MDLFSSLSLLSDQQQPKQLKPIKKLSEKNDDNGDKKINLKDNLILFTDGYLTSETTCEFINSSKLLSILENMKKLQVEIYKSTPVTEYIFKYPFDKDKLKFKPISNTIYLDSKSYTTSPQNLIGKKCRFHLKIKPYEFKCDSTAPEKVIIGIQIKALSVHVL